MFKSVFARYISAFMVIFLVSFTLLGVVLGVMVSDYARDEKTAAVTNAAENVKEMVNKSYYAYLSRLEEEGIAADPARFLLTERASLAAGMSAVSDYSNFGVFLVDREGAILITDSNSEGLHGRLPSDVMGKVLDPAQGSVSQVGTLGDLFEEKQVIYGVKLGLNLAAEQPAGAVFAVSSASEMSSFVSRMMSTMITACVIVMVAGLLASYVLSERISTPIRKMCRAAESFSRGDFSVRVETGGSDEVAGLADAFNHMAESLDELEKKRDSFISSVAHDLRTPMTSISGFVDGILDGVIPPEKTTYYLGIVSAEVKRLSRLVSSLLDVTRIQAGERKFKMAPFDICETARQILLSFEEKIDGKHLEVEFDCSQDNILAVGDEDAIHQVLYNLIDNAVKFSREGGLLRISVQAENRARKVAIVVYNEGQGISKEDLPHIFEQFYKADKSRGLDKSGVGLGMYIAKTILVAHGEDITVESEEGKYCAFTFRLPLSK